MLSLIFQPLFDAISSAFGSLMEDFLAALNLDLGQLIKSFPFLVSAYQIFRAVAIGFIIAIAAVSLIKFFTAGITEAKDAPSHIIIKVIIASALLWFGGYILNYIVDLAKIPYDIFNEAQVFRINGADLTKTITESLTSLGTDGISDLGGILLKLLCLIVICWNIIKLTIEVCERYLMVGILVYTSPLVYPTIISRDTSTIFRKWFNMFISSCIMMIMSVFSFKLILSGLLNMTNEKVFVQLLLILAACKVAQRIDSYMTQLGLNPAITGSNLLDDVFAMGRTLGGVARGLSGSHANKDSVLGKSDASKAAKSTATYGGFKGTKDAMRNDTIAHRGGVVGMFRAGAKAAKDGATVGGVVGAAAAGLTTPLAAQVYQQERKAGASVAGATAEAIRAYRVAGLNPLKSYTGSHVAENAASAADDAAVAAATKRAQASMVKNPYAESFVADAQQHGMSPADYAQYQRTVNGSVGGFQDALSDGKVSLSEEATNAGIFFDNKRGVLSGDEASLAAFIPQNEAAAFAQGASHQEMLENTVRNSSPAVNEGALMTPSNPDMTIIPSSMPIEQAAYTQRLRSAEVSSAFGYLDTNRNPNTEYMEVQSVRMPEGGRSLSYMYETTDGSCNRVNMMDAEAFAQLAPEQQSGYSEVTSATGAKYYRTVETGARVSETTEKINEVRHKATPASAAAQPQAGAPSSNNGTPKTSNKGNGGKKGKKPKGKK